MHKLWPIALLCGCLPAWGWGSEGHRLVARIAEARLTAAARARVAAILGPRQSLVSIASWADEVRPSRPETGPWHYVNIPIDRPHLDMALDCPKGECVLVKIEEFRGTLRDPAAAPEQRQEALKFLVHLIGDMHQPLHCSDNKDRGGNEVPIRFFGTQTNLHRLWDSGLLDRLGPDDRLLLVLLQESDRHAKKWSQGTVKDWAEESHKAAQKVVYGRLGKVAAGTPVEVTEAYERKADPLIREQIERAGIRLAAVLNRTLE